MSVYLNGTKLPGHNLTVSGMLTLAGEDLSGNSSTTAQADKGDKPKTLSVRLSVKFINAADLTALVALAEARDAAGDRVKYNIINDLAKAMNIRQVQFQGSFNCPENAGLRQWDISLDLVEWRSVPEKKQQRLQAKPVANQTVTGQTVSQTAPQTSTPSASVPAQLTAFEQNVLAPLNDLLK